MSAKYFYIQPNWLPSVRAMEKLIHLKELRDFWALPEKYARRWASDNQNNQRDPDTRTSGEH